MTYDTISNQTQLLQFCKALSSAEFIAFDTEFVSEDTYRSELCLIQVATADHLAVIDPQEIEDLTPFWEVLTAPGHETIVHAGREELVFCLSTIGRPPANLFDIQIAAGLIGLEYPASYGNLMHKLIGATLQKGETRTDWRRRPLTPQQLDYALDDVRYLKKMRDVLHAQLAELGRLPWLENEIQTWQSDVQETLTRERWRRVSGISGLNPRALAIVREVWRCREQEAARRNLPPKRVLRDDLIIELAKRRSYDPKQMRAVRGMERGDIQRMIPDLSQAVKTALEMPDDQLPKSVRREVPSQLNVLGQFLSAALTSICRSAKLAPSIVGTANDVRELIAYRMGYTSDETPTLAQGWRAEIIGQMIDDLLAGRRSIRIANPESNEPLVFEPVANQADTKS